MVEESLHIVKRFTTLIEEAFVFSSNYLIVYYISESSCHDVQDGALSTFIIRFLQNLVLLKLRIQQCYLHLAPIHG